MIGLLLALPIVSVPLDLLRFFLKSVKGMRPTLAESVFLIGTFMTFYLTVNIVAR